MKITGWILCFTCLVIFVGCKCNNDSATDSTEELETVSTDTLDNQTTAQNSGEAEDSMFRFLGEGVDPDTHKVREENFDKCPYEVTENNIHTLYREYKVEKIAGTDLYLIEPFKLYTTSKYFTRLLRFENGKQVAARTFYAWEMPYIFQQGDKYMLGLNSLPTTSGMNTSTFTCKTELVDKNLNTIAAREYRYPEQSDSYYAYSFIDTLYKVPNGYAFRIINKGFDPEDYYQYDGILSADNVVLESAKKNIKVK